MKIVLFGITITLTLIFSIAVVTWNAFGQNAHPPAANSAISIPACAFQEFRNSYDFFRSAELSINSGGEEYYAPVSLPHGATIRKVQLIGQDWYPSGNMKLFLYRQNRSSQSFEMAKVVTSGSEWKYKTFSTTAVSPRLVNNFKNSYYLKVELTVNHPFYIVSQVKILYDAP